MADQTCYACQGALTPIDARRAECTNPSCPEGGVFYRCGYCKAIALALDPELLYCVNPACRSYRRKREKCESCGKISVLTHEDQAVCVNRVCSTNRSILAVCFFCSNRAFLRSPNLMFCTKGDCRYLFSRTEPCFFCKKQSYVTEEKTCQNSSCRYAGIPMDPCPSCDQRTLSEDPEGKRTCLNDACGQPPAEADEFEGTLMSVLPEIPGKKKAATTCSPSCRPRSKTPPSSTASLPNAPPATDSPCASWAQASRRNKNLM